MILEALNRYYETLCARGELSEPGWDDALKVSFGLDLSDSGDILRVINLREEVNRGKKVVSLPRRMRVPMHFVRSSGFVPALLCDNATYLLGISIKGNPQQALSSFVSAKNLHNEVLSQVDDPAAAAILAFFNNWDPNEASEHPILKDYMESFFQGCNILLCYNGNPTSEVPAIQDAWQKHFNTPDPFAIKGRCLVTGRIDPIAVTHPKIKGIKDGQPTGTSLVSFNEDSFCFYRHTRGFNAPISERAAFAYTTALNTLLADQEHSRTIGDITLVCWSENGDHAYQDAYMAALLRTDIGNASQMKPDKQPSSKSKSLTPEPLDNPNEESSSEDLMSTEKALSLFLSKVARGERLAWNGLPLDANEHFYILGLSPNAGRVSVRFFYHDSFGEILHNICKHYDDLAIISPNFDIWEHLPLWKLLLETVNEKSTNKSASHQMSGETFRSILTGTPYPRNLLTGAYARIIAEHEVTRGRAAIIKAYFTRSNIPFPKEALSVELNPNCNDTPYILGRLFWIYENIQKTAYPNLNCGIKDNMFTAAASTPARAFAAIAKKANQHLRVIRRDTPGLSYYLESKLDAIHAQLGETIPAQLSLNEQCSFFLGYYHERQNTFSSKSKDKNNIQIDAMEE